MKESSDCGFFFFGFFLQILPFSNKTWKQMESLPVKFNYNSVLTDCYYPCLMNFQSAEELIELLSNSQYAQEQFSNYRHYAIFLIKVKRIAECHYKYSAVLLQRCSGTQIMFSRRKETISIQICLHFISLYFLSSCTDSTSLWNTLSWLQRLWNSKRSVTNIPSRPLGWHPNWSQQRTAFQIHRPLQKSDIRIFIGWLKATFTFQRFSLTNRITQHLRPQLLTQGLVLSPTVYPSCFSRLEPRCTHTSAWNRADLQHHGPALRAPVCWILFTRTQHFVLLLTPRIQRFPSANHCKAFIVKRGPSVSDWSLIQLFYCRTRWKWGHKFNLKKRDLYSL